MQFLNWEMMAVTRGQHARDERVYGHMMAFSQDHKLTKY